MTVVAPFREAAPGRTRATDDSELQQETRNPRSGGAAQQDLLLAVAEVAEAARGHQETVPARLEFLLGIGE